MLNRDAAVYRSFEEQPAGSPEAMFFERLDALDVTTLMPLVLLLHVHPGVARDRRRRTLAVLESWLVRRMLVRLTTKNYNLEVAQLMARVGEAPERADEVVRAHLASATSETARWPGDAEVIAAL